MKSDEQKQLVKSNIKVDVRLIFNTASLPIVVLLHVNNDKPRLKLPVMWCFLQSPPPQSSITQLANA